jgi:hypothetical protein
MAGKMPSKYNDGKKKMIEIITIPMEGALLV